MGRPPLPPPGWFSHADEHLFRVVDSAQSEVGVDGDILEIGVYWGLSALTLADLRRGGERLVLVDVFDTLPSSGPEAGEMRTYARRPPPSVAEFLESWRQHTDRDPDEIVVGPSSELEHRHDLDGRFRLAHVDGSHAYDAVKEDLRTVRRLSRPGAVVVVDDYRSMHTPGVAAAVWEAVHNDGLVPLCATDLKMYATWEPELCGLDHVRIMQNVAADESAYLIPGVAGHRLVVLRGSVPIADPFAPPRTRLRNLARAVLPPVVASAIASARRRATRSQPLP